MIHQLSRDSVTGPSATSLTQHKTISYYKGSYNIIYILMAFYFTYLLKQQIQCEFIYTSIPVHILLWYMEVQLKRLSMNLEKTTIQIYILMTFCHLKLLTTSVVQGIY